MSNTVTTKLLYFSPPADGSSPFIYINADPASGTRRRNWEHEPHDVQVENIRGKEDTFSLDGSGFQYGRRASTHESFLSNGAVEREYYPESIALVKELTGASRVVPFDHTIRRRRPGEVDDSPEKRQPVPQVHVDQTPQSARARVERHLPAEDVPELLAHRFQIINLWRPIAEPAYDWPLALCDFASVDAKNDLVPVALKYPDRDGETFGVNSTRTTSSNICAGWNRTMLIDRLHSYDSRDDGKTASFTPHTAFEDPTTPPGAPLRESIELRLLVFYD
ncbi:Uncharacterized protein in dcmA 3'region [Grifola frondosa]|uniref:Uncharacterized protein in dcmA 3'region n=1 Tax=Grifola frondosa TaxID=5627 RepID=A0A1C7LTK4_GRIFR|nr:Uncharacterized protein in dcmA 3'region [Grifola frondosa]